MTSRNPDFKARRERHFELKALALRVRRSSHTAHFDILEKGLVSRTHMSNAPISYVILKLSQGWTFNPAWLRAVNLPPLSLGKLNCSWTD